MSFTNYSLTVDDKFLSASSNSSSIDAVHGKPIKAVVLLLGWWGAQHSQLSKYAKLYEDRNCVTIQGISDPYAVLRLDKRSFEVFAKAAAKMVATVLRTIDKNDTNAKHAEDRKVPVIIHALSNGGCYVVESLENLMVKAVEVKKKNHHAEGEKDASDDDLLLVYDRLKGQVFDSSPAFVSAQTAIRAIHAANIFSNPLIRMFVSLSFHVNDLYQRFQNLFVKVPSDPGKDFWDHMIQSNVCLKQAYIYSTGDHVTDCQKLDELIEERRKLLASSASKPTKKGAGICVKRFEDSKHVLHLRQHPEEYKEFISAFLNSR